MRNPLSGFLCNLPIFFQLLNKIWLLELQCMLIILLFTDLICVYYRVSVDVLKTVIVLQYEEYRKHFSISMLVEGLRRER